MGRGTRPFTFSSILVQSSVFYRLAFSAKVELTRAAVLPLLAQIHGLNLDTLDSYSDSWGPVGPESVTSKVPAYGKAKRKVVTPHPFVSADQSDTS